MLGLLVDRRWHLVSGQHKTIVRLHALLCDLVPGGVRGRLSRTRAAEVLRSIRPTSRVDAQRNRRLNSVVHTAAVTRISHSARGQLPPAARRPDQPRAGLLVMAHKPGLSTPT